MSVKNEDYSPTNTKHKATSRLLTATLLAGLALAGPSTFHHTFAADQTDSSARPIGYLEVVHRFSNGPMPTGVSVSQAGRIFANFPRWGDDLAFTVGEIRNGNVVPYPSKDINNFDPARPDLTLSSVQSVVVDAADRLWVLDTAAPGFQTRIVGAAK